MKYETLDDKVVVITGASSGLGQGSALAYAEKGANLVLAARREELLNEVAEKCRIASKNRPVKVLVVPTDVSEADHVKTLIERTLSEFNRIDLWINDAGAGAIGRFVDVPLEDHVKVIQTDLLGTLYGSYFALKQFQQQNYGTLINISSVVGKIPTPYYASYVAAKFGVAGMSAALYQEMSEEKYADIDICTVFPMATNTPFFEHAANYTDRESVPLPPTYDAQDVIQAIVNLASHPKEETVIGGMGNMMTWLHGLVPGMVEKMMAKETTQAQLKDAEHAPPTSGILQEPSLSGTGVSSGWK